MNWARGLKFAEIHVAIAVLLIGWEEVPRLSAGKRHSERAESLIMLAAWQEEQTFEFYPCNVWRSISWREKLLIASELPVLIVAGWNEPCPPRWTVAGMVGIGVKHHSIEQRLGLDVIICCLIAIQWIFLGGLPLVKPRRWWLEPGAADTSLTSATAILCLAIAGLESTHLQRAESIAAVAGFLALLALLLIFSTWLAWIGLIAERLFRLGWRGVTGAVRRAQTR